MRGPVAGLCQETRVEAMGHVAVPELSRTLMVGARVMRHVTTLELPSYGTPTSMHVLSYLLFLT
jgi:hypothetical protein